MGRKPRNARPEVEKPGNHPVSLSDDAYDMLLRLKSIMTGKRWTPRETSFRTLAEEGLRRFLAEEEG